MNLVAVCKFKNRVYVAVDSWCYEGDYRDYVREEDNAFDDMITSDGTIAVCYAHDSIRRCFQIKKEQLFNFKGKRLTKQYIIEKVIPNIKETFSDEAFIRRNGTINARIIIAKGNKAFLISNDCSVVEIEDYEVAGAGAFYGLSCFNREITNIKETMYKYFSVVNKNHERVVPPYMIADTKTLKFEKLEEVL